MPKNRIHCDRLFSPPSRPAQPQAEQKLSFYAAIPIAMSVTGNYHEIGVFLDSISKLARIVNVTNIKMSQAKTVNEKLVVQATYMATTFRELLSSVKQEIREVSIEELKRLLDARW